MLISFTIKNFRSFQDEQTLSMVASTQQPDHLEHLSSIPDDEHQILPIAAMYGANGAGKSNWVKALAFLENLVVRGTEPQKPIATGQRAFALDTGSSGAPTELSIQFNENGRIYSYGCQVGDKVVHAEWLSLVRNGKELSVYERLTKPDEEVVIDPGPQINSADFPKVFALTKVGVLPNQLFLHAVGKNLRAQDQGPVLAGALHWFQHRLNIVPANVPFSSLAELISRDKTFTDFAGDFLQKVGTGVDRLSVDSTQLEEGMLRSLASPVQHIIENLTTGQVASIPVHDGMELMVEKGVGTKIALRTLNAEHVKADGTRVALPFSEESDGTRRLTYLLPALHFISNNPGVFIIDEIDRSLHPLLAKGFVRTFLKACAGKGSQIIFTTHDTSFMDLELLRRDEIWFANKQPSTGATQIYSLADYKVRTDLKIDKSYLQGRFEAIPPIEEELPDWVRHIMEQLDPRKSSSQPPYEPA